MLDEIVHAERTSMSHELMISALNDKSSKTRALLVASLSKGTTASTPVQINIQLIPLKD